MKVSDATSQQQTDVFKRFSAFSSGIRNKTTQAGGKVVPAFTDNGASRRTPTLADSFSFAAPGLGEFDENVDGRFEFFLTRPFEGRVRVVFAGG